jgi:parallel beta-helix repeat protein
MSGATQQGIYLMGGSNPGFTINNNNLSNCGGYGLYYNYGTPTSVNSNTMTGSANALYLSGANTFTLGTANVFKNQTGNSIELYNSTAVNISNNTLNGTGGNGIYMNASNSCVLNNNSTCGRSTGISINGSSNLNTISNGNIISCATGIQLSSTSVNNTTITAVNLFNTTNINNAGLNTVITSTTSTNTSPIISVNSGAICSGSSFTMTPSGAATYSYTGGSAIVSPTIATNYSVTGTDANGCVSAIPAVSGVTVNVCAVAAALNFDGINDNVNLGNGITTSLSGGTKVSVEAWVKPTTLSGLGVIVGNYSTGSANLQILLRRNYNLYYEFWIGNGGNWYQTGSTVPPTLNTWQHVAGTWDGTVASIYVNGVLSGTTTPAISTLGNAGSNPAWIGGNTINENFTGNIDEVRIWNVARTQCDINTYKNCEIPTTATGLLANYHFNQGVDAGTNTSVTTLTDASGNTNTGTLTNFTLTSTTSNWVAPGGVVSGSVTPANLTPTVGSTVTNSVICSGNSTTLNGTGADSYSWTNGVTDATAFSPTVTATYTVTGTNTLTGCFNTALNTVTVNALPTITVSSGSICSGQSYTIIANGATTYTSVPSLTGPVVSPTITTNYSITGTDANGCVSSNTAVSTVTVNNLPTISVNSGSICAGNSFTMTPSGASTYTYSNGSAVVTPTSNASYNVTGTDANGCISSSAAVSSVTVNALPIVMATTNNTLLCTGNSATLTATGAISYTWNTSATTTVIAVSPTTTVTYTVNGTDANGCSNVATVTQSVSTCAGIEALSNDAAIKLYPNPNNGLFTIELTSPSKVTVTNALGQIVITETFEAGNHNLDILNQSNGVYFVKIIENNKQQIIKVIKQ